MDLIRVLIFFTCKYDFGSQYMFFLQFSEVYRFLNIFPFPSLLVTLLSQNITSENWIMLFRHFAADLTPTMYVLPIKLTYQWRSVTWAL